jgi:hypothetical protein
MQNLRRRRLHPHADAANVSIAVIAPAMRGVQIAGNGDDDGMRIRRALLCKRSMEARREQDGEATDGCPDDCAHPGCLATSLPLTAQRANSYLMVRLH